MRHGNMSALMRSSDEKPKKLDWKEWLRVLSYAKPYWKNLGFILLLILINTGLSLVTPLVFRKMIDDVLPAKDLNQLFLLAGALFLIPVLKGGVMILQRRENARVGEGVIFELRKNLFEKLQRMGIRFYTHTKVGELMSRLNNDVVGAHNAISSTIVQFITNLITAVGILTVMFTLQWQLTLFGLLIMPLFVLISKTVGIKLREIAQHSMESNAVMNAHMNETLNIGGSLLVKLFGRQDDEINRFAKHAEQVRDIGITRAMYGSAFMMLIGLIGSVGTALVYGLGGYLVIVEVFTIGTIVAFGSYLEQLYGALQGLSTAPVDLMTSMVSFERVFEILDLKNDVEEAPNAVDLPDAKGELSFERVSFEYERRVNSPLSEVKRRGSIENVTNLFAESSPDEDTDLEINVETTHSQARTEAILDLSFSASPGKLVALVGPSGAGKTTTTYLIPRLYDPKEGRILIDGVDIRDLKLSSLAKLIGMVTQENYLFHDSIRNNINYADPSSSFESIQNAAKIANIHDFIMGLPDKYETLVGERGYRLSGGEKQRIALARVILKDPKILVLDEATSSLDSESEASIQEALKIMMRGRTSIVIAHRLSTILSADEILVMDRGQITERGTHEQLIQKDGLYRHLYETQFRSIQG